MTWLLAGLLIAVLVSFYFVHQSQRQVYAQILSMLEHERDAARQESKVYLGLLLPRLNKAEADSEEAADATAVPSKAQRSSTRAAAPHPAPPDPRRRPMNIPFRVWFNQVRKLSNSKQQKTDALAGAIEQARAAVEAQKTSVQEKTHVS